MLKKIIIGRGKIVGRNTIVEIYYLNLWINNIEMLGKTVQSMC